MTWPQGVLVEAQLHSTDVDQILAALSLPGYDIAHGLTLGGPNVADLVRDHPAIGSRYEW